MWAVEQIINGVKHYYNRYNSKESCWDSKINYQTAGEDKEFCENIAKRHGGRVVQIDVDTVRVWLKIQSSSGIETLTDTIPVENESPQKTAEGYMSNEHKNKSHSAKIVEWGWE